MTCFRLNLDRLYVIPVSLIIKRVGVTKWTVFYVRIKRERERSWHEHGGIGCTWKLKLVRMASGSSLS